GWLSAQLEATGIPCERFRLRRPVSPSCARDIAHMLRQHGVSIAHSHEFSMAVYGAWASRLAGIPHVITMHGSGYYAQKLQRRVAMRAAIALSARTVAVSTPLARDLSQSLAISLSKVLVIPNGTHYSRPERVTLRAELKLPPHARLLVAVGNLYPVK